MKEKQMSDQVKVSVAHYQHSGRVSTVYVQDELLVPRWYTAVNGERRLMLAQWKEHRGTDVEISLAREQAQPWGAQFREACIEEEVRRRVGRVLAQRGANENARIARRILRDMEAAKHDQAAS
jgi:hypothetical protein